MITDNAYKEGIAILSTTFRIIPESDGDRKIVLRMWRSVFDERFEDDREFLLAVKRFVLNTPKLYPGDNWLAMFLELAKPKVKETVGDVINLIFDVINTVSFLYPNEATKNKLAWLESHSPIAYAIGNRIGWAEMAKSTNLDVLRGQIRAIADEEIRRANESGIIPKTASQAIGDERGAVSLKQIIQNTAIGGQKLLDIDKHTRE